jgi:aldose 1-epimerase
VAASETFGALDDGRTVLLFTLANRNGIRVRVITYGCTIVSLETPDRHHHFANIVLAYDRLQGYVGGRTYYGAVVGRYANRIADARFVLDRRIHAVSPNEPPNHLHGGFQGFDKHLWEAVHETGSPHIRFRRTSVDGEEGYPGNVDVQVSYTLTDRNELRVDYEARTDAVTHINLTQHSYFNLRGAGDVLDHRLAIDADAYLPVDGRLIPTGEIAPVAGTPFDFHEPSPIGARYGGNYDHNFVLNHRDDRMTVAARLLDEHSGRSLEVRTTEPGLQLYSAGHHRGVCLETQHFPDSPNRPEFPSTILRPESLYTSHTEFVFGIG